MKIPSIATTARTGLAAALIAFSTTTFASYMIETDTGNPGTDKSYSRTITISPSAKWVNVNRDESIRFVDAATGNSFVWHFDTRASTLDFGKIAPAGFLGGRMITAYVGRSARESARDR